MMMVLTVAFATLTGCSKNSNPSPTAQTTDGRPGASTRVDACSLLTTAEATAVLGEQSADAKPGGGGLPNASQCEWNAVSGDASIAILIWIGGQKAAWANIVATSKQTLNYADVPGLGDAAFSNGIDLHILKGDNMYQIGVLASGDKIAEATAVAQKALARV
jgi:hypothetical protein